MRGGSGTCAGSIYESFLNSVKEAVEHLCSLSRPYLDKMSWWISLNASLASEEKVSLSIVQQFVMRSFEVSTLLP